MLAYRMGLSAIAALLLTACQQTQLATTEYGYSQTAASGVKTRMGDYNSVGRTSAGCVSAPARVTVLQHGQHGTVSTGPGQSIARTSGSPIASCDGQSLATTNVYYQSSKGYRGLDEVRYGVLYRDGASETYRKFINVR